jgi:hypothetical protein
MERFFSGKPGYFVGKIARKSAVTVDVGRFTSIPFHATKYVEFSI